MKNKSIAFSREKDGMYRVCSVLDLAPKAPMRVFSYNNYKWLDIHAEWRKVPVQGKKIRFPHRWIKWTNYNRLTASVML